MVHLRTCLAVIDSMSDGQAADRGRVHGRLDHPHKAEVQAVREVILGVIDCQQGDSP
jgi:hypothetical protein